MLDAVVTTMVAASGLRPGGRVLDYGCAQRPYERLLPDGVEYVGADLPGNPSADVELKADGTVPLPDASFDVVLSTQVLEHVEDPGLYLAECRRLLKPGGSLILTTHGIMYYHRDPEDYWRWTVPGLSVVVAAAGLEIVDQDGVLGLAATGLQLVQDAWAYKVPRPLRRAFFLVMQAMIRLADRRQTPQTRSQNGMVIAVRAVAPTSF